MGLKRTIDAAFLDAIGQALWFPVVFVDVDWPSGRVNVHSAAGPLTWGGFVWDGIGNFGQISIPDDSTGSAIGRATLRLYGLLSEELADLATPSPRNVEVSIYVGALAEPADAGATPSLIGTPVSLYHGRCDTQVFKITGEGEPKRPGYRLQHYMEIEITNGNAPRRAQPLNHSSETQRTEGFVTDTAGRHLVGIRERRRDWPPA